MRGGGLEDWETKACSHMQSAWLLGQSMAECGSTAIYLGKIVEQSVCMGMHRYEGCEMRWWGAWAARCDAV